MSDHDFEKQVQVRLEQLKLRPSEAVWTEVEKNIRRDKRRRRMIVWLPILLLMLGAGGYFAITETSRSAEQGLVKQSTPSSSSATQNDKPSTHQSTQIQEETTPSIATKDNDQATAHNATTDKVAPVADPADNNNQPSAIATVPAADKAVTSKPSKNIDNKTAGNKITGNKNVKEPVITNQVPADKLVKQQRTENGRRQHQPSSVAPVIAGKKQTDPKQALTAGKDSSIAIVTNDDVKQPVEDTIAVAVVPVTTADSSLAQTTPVDSVAKDTTQTIATAPVTPAPTPTVAIVKQEKKKGAASKWQWGIQAEVGYSGVTKDGLFGFLENKSEVADLASPQFSNAINYNPQFPRPVNKASSLSMGPAFSIGGFVQRRLSNRVSLSLGLQYSYLSARQVVGTKVNNNRTVNRAPSTSQLVSSYYDANNNQEYTNKYHFVELPVTLHTQLNKGKRLPIIWDIGFSASRLLNTTALHYDGLGGVYYKDNSLFDRMQWVASTGFNVGLFSQSKHPVSVGPMMRYNISSLLKKEYSTGQHLWSLGLRASILLKK